MAIWTFSAPARAWNIWARVVPEMGPICGFLFLGARVALALYLVFRARSALSQGSTLAWLLIPVAVPLVLMGIMEQGTYLGFLVFASGICLAAARQPRLPLVRWTPSVAHAAVAGRA